MSATTEPTTTPTPTAVTAPTTGPGQLTKETYRGRIHPDWCPGCGDFSVLASLQTALFELGLQPHQVCVISGIGCSSNLPGYVNTYGMHTLHGRALAVATGVRLGNHEVKVICTGGDGDGYGIGGNHFVHTMRRNVDLTYIVMDNQIYGLTTGQCSPTSVKGMKTKSTPHGSVENPINPTSTRRSSVVISVATKFQLDCSGVGPIWKAWKIWSRCCTREKARSPSARSAFPRNKLSS